MLARVLGSELERESEERDQRRFEELLRDQARGMGAVGRVTRALAAGEDAAPHHVRRRLRGRGAPVRVSARAGPGAPSSVDRDGGRRARARDDPAARGRGPAAGAPSPPRRPTSSPTRAHAALAAPLVEATQARSAAFEPVVRDGRVAAVLIVIWRAPLEALPGAPGRMLRLLAAQAAVAIERARTGRAGSPSWRSRTRSRARHATQVGRGVARASSPAPAARRRRCRSRCSTTPPRRLQRGAGRARGRPAAQGVPRRAGAAPRARSCPGPAR